MISKTRKGVMATAHVALALLAMIAPAAQAMTNYDLNADWSDSSNPNGVWTYREGGNALPHVASWQNALGGWGVAQPGWAKSENGGDRLPFIFKSNGSETFAHDFLAGDVVMHSTDSFNGVGNGPGNIIWTSPLTGFATITGNIWMGRDIDRSNHWALLDNSILLTGGDVSSGDPFNRANPFDFSAGSGGTAVLSNIPVNAGDVLQLQVTNTSALGDFMGMNFAVAFSSLLGDLNQDGHVNAADIAVMMSALSNLQGYETANGLTDPQLLLSVADVNHDDRLNGADLQALLNYLKTGHGSVDPIPEPSTFILAVVAIGAVVGWRRIQR